MTIREAEMTEGSSDGIFLHSVHLLPDRSYLSLDWEPEIKKKYFDETVVEVKPTTETEDAHRIWAAGSLNSMHTDHVIKKWQRDPDRSSRKSQRRAQLSRNQKVTGLFSAAATASWRKALNVCQDAMIHFNTKIIKLKMKHCSYWF